MQPNIIKNFISENTASYIHSHLRQKAIINPHGLLNVYLPYHGYETLEGSVVSDLINLIVSSIAHEFGLEKDKVFLNRVNYQVLRDGQGLGYHTDNRGAYEGTMKNAGYSVLLYLTDDYTGGEILFYDKDNTSKDYRPTPGTLIYFRGDEDHPHSVNDVISGERANLILFYDVDGGDK